MLLHAHHVLLIALIDDSNDEIHEHDVSYEHDKYIGNPCNDLVVWLFNIEGAFSPDDPQRHNKITQRTKTCTICIWLFEDNHKNKTEGCNNYRIVQEEEAQVLENSWNHLDQYTEFIKYLHWLVYLDES